MGKGWIKLHRAIEEHPRFKDAKWLQVWIKCLVLATHQPYKTVFGGKVIELLPGQFITSRRSLATETDTHESKVERILKVLETEHQIEQVGGSVSRLITITKWEEFQNGEQDSEQQSNNERTTVEQRPNTNKNNKNIKNRRSKKETGEVPDSLVPPPDPENLEATNETLRAVAACELLADPDFSVSWTQFLEMRKGKKKPATEYAQNLMLKQLQAHPLNIAIRMVEESTINSWTGVYPLKDGANGQNGSGGGNPRGYESPAQRNARKLRANLGLDASPGADPAATGVVLPLLSAGATGSGHAGN